MKLHSDLLVQARQLATLDPRRPKQANLRRAVSSAYYALFHYLVDEGASWVSRQQGNGASRDLTTRKFDHGTMDKVSRAVASGTPDWVKRSGLQFPHDIRKVADTFAFLQEERHAADYNLSSPFTRARAIEAVERGEAAFEAWERARRSDAANYYLLALLLGPPRS